MKTYMKFPALVLLGSAAAVVLRVLFFRTGLEADTGLPIPGNPYALALPILLAALFLVFALMVRRLPDEKNHSSSSLPAAFCTGSAGILTVCVMGLFLLIASGLLEIYGALTGTAGRIGIFSGVVTLLIAGCLFPVLSACRARPEGETPRTGGAGAILVSVGLLVVHLVLIYREVSINPSLVLYYVEILSMVFLTLAFYRLSSFVFQVGRTRRFVFYTLCAVVLCLTTLVDGHRLSSTLFYGGCAVTLLGFLLVRLDTLAALWRTNS